MTPPVAVSPDGGITSPDASVPVFEKKSRYLAIGLLNERRAILYFLNIYEGYAMRTIPEPPFPPIIDDCPPVPPPPPPVFSNELVPPPPATPPGPAPA
jgi:hypothetical protein